MADLDKLANSTASVVTTRITIMIIPLMMAALGWFITDKLSTIGESQKGMWTYIGKADEKLNSIQTAVAVGNAAFVSHKSEDENFDNTVKAAIADHEQRLRLLQSAPPAKQ